MLVNGGLSQLVGNPWVRLSGMVARAVLNGRQFEEFGGGAG